MVVDMIFICYWNDMGDGYFLIIILSKIIVFHQCYAIREFKASISFQAWQSICRRIKFQKIGIAAVLRFINRRLIPYLIRVVTIQLTFWQTLFITTNFFELNSTQRFWLRWNFPPKCEGKSFCVPNFYCYQREH